MIENFPNKNSQNDELIVDFQDPETLHCMRSMHGLDTEDKTKSGIETKVRNTSPCFGVDDKTNEATTNLS